MNMAVSGAVGRGEAAHAGPANFGQLNSAIARGDLAAAQSAFTALDRSTAPAAAAAKARGSLEAAGAAIASGDTEAARTSLADFRAGRITETAPAPAPTPVSDTVVEALPAAPSTTEQIVALLSGTGSTIAISA